MTEGGERKLLSIIIPNYNNGKFLPRCIESIISCVGANIEIIVMDDGSTDNSRDYLLSIKDKRVRVFCQENQGVSVARNECLKYVTGKYVTFCDSDDYYVDGAIEILLSLLKKTELGKGVLLFDALSEKLSELGNRVRSPWHPFNSDRNNPQEITEIEYQDYLGHICRYSFMNPLWNKVYSYDLLKEKKICFPEHIPSGEDGIFNLKYTMICDKILYLHRPLYVYCEGESEFNSIKLNKPIKKLDNLLVVLSMRRDCINVYLDNEHTNNRLVRFMHQYEITQIYSCVKAVRDIDGKHAYKEYAKENREIKFFLKSALTYRLGIKRRIQLILMIMWTR